MRSSSYIHTHDTHPVMQFLFTYALYALYIHILRNIDVKPFIINTCRKTNTPNAHKIQPSVKMYTKAHIPKAVEKHEMRAKPPIYIQTHG